MRFQFMLVMALSLLLSACANVPKAQIDALAQPLSYALDSGDVLRVSVYGESEVSGDYRVGDGGEVAIPLVGSINVRGHSTQSAAARVTAALARGYMRNPDVVIEVTEYRPFFIEGAVLNSGRFQFAPGLTARAAVSMAGGFIETANRQSVTAYRRQGEQMVVIKLDLDQPVAPGDILSIGQRWF